MLAFSEIVKFVTSGVPSYLALYNDLQANSDHLIICVHVRPIKRCSVISPDLWENTLPEFLKLLLSAWPCRVFDL